MLPTSTSEHLILQVLTVLCNIAAKGPALCQIMHQKAVLPSLIHALAFSHDDVVGQDLELLHLLFLHWPEVDVPVVWMGSLLCCRKAQAWLCCFLSWHRQQQTLWLSWDYRPCSSIRVTNSCKSESRPSSGLPASWPLPLKPVPLALCRKSYRWRLSRVDSWCPDHQ